VLLGDLPHDLDFGAGRGLNVSPDSIGVIRRMQILSTVFVAGCAEMHINPQTSPQSNLESKPARAVQITNTLFRRRFHGVGNPATVLGEGLLSYCTHAQPQAGPALTRCS
jgi:hypothetical protein